MTYYTYNEIEFIKKLGMGQFATRSAAVQSKSRLQMLKGYLKGIKKRANWGKINRHEVFEFVLSEINSLEQGGKWK